MAPSTQSSAPLSSRARPARHHARGQPGDRRGDHHGDRRRHEPLHLRQHLASWAGVCPGHHESAGRAKSTKVRSGNPYLKGALGLAAFGAARIKDTYRQARYKHLTARRGPLKALVAIEHSLITAIWHMLTDHQPYRELGGTYFTQHDPERATRRAINALNQLGYTLTLNPIDAAA